MGRRGVSRTATTPGLVVIIRGPMGAGKTTLMNGLAKVRSYHFWVLDTDAATAALPPDPNGDHLGEEWQLECQILGKFARAILAYGLNVVLDPGTLLTRREVDIFLRAAGRRRGDPRVILIRLGVPLEEAVRRKTTVRASYVRASNLGWQPAKVPGEIFIDTTGRSATQVLSMAKHALRGRVGTDRDRPVPTIRRFPKQRPVSAPMSSESLAKVSEAQESSLKS